MSPPDIDKDNTNMSSADQRIVQTISDHATAAAIRAQQQLAAQNHLKRQREALQKVERDWYTTQHRFLSRTNFPPGTIAAILAMPPEDITAVPMPVANIAAPAPEIAPEAPQAPVDLTQEEDNPGDDLEVKVAMAISKAKVDKAKAIEIVFEKSKTDPECRRLLVGALRGEKSSEFDVYVKEAEEKVKEEKVRTLAAAQTLLLMMGGSSE